MRGSDVTIQGDKYDLHPVDIVILVFTCQSVYSLICVEIRRLDSVSLLSAPAFWAPVFWLLCQKRATEMVRYSVTRLGVWDIISRLGVMSV